MKSPLIQFVGALVLLISSVLGYGVWYATIAAQSASVANLESQINTKTAAASRVASARAALAKIAGDEAAVQSYFVPETGVVSFIDDLETRARAQGTVLSVLSVSTSGTGAQSAFVFALTINGSFDAVMRTVGAIEYAPYALSISALSLGQDPKKGWNANLSLLVGSIAQPSATSTSSAPSSASSSVSVPIPSSASSAHPQAKAL